MRPARYIVMATDAEQTLAQSLDTFLEALREGGAGPAQTNAMTMAFYLGAAQVFTMVEHAACNKNATAFSTTMLGLNDEITEFMNDSPLAHETEGHA